MLWAQNSNFSASIESPDSMNDSEWIFGAFPLLDIFTCEVETDSVKIMSSSSTSVSNRNCGTEITTYLVKERLLAEAAKIETDQDAALIAKRAVAAGKTLPRKIYWQMP